MMKPVSSRVGPRGLALLATTAVAGLVLAVHGWSGRSSAQAPGALAGATSSPAAASSPSAASPSPGPARPATAPRTGTASPATRPGPVLSTQPFASYSYQVWPGTPDAAARGALTGLSVSVRRQGSGISVTAGAIGQPPPASRLYPQGARVYIVEATMGDDSGASDYNMGDDGLLVTDAQGRILP